MSARAGTPTRRNAKAAKTTKTTTTDESSRSGKDGAARPTTTTYREALREAHREAMRRDDRVFLMGEDVGRYGGAFAVSLGLLDEFGPDRVRDAPLSEAAFTGAGSGRRCVASARSSRS
jgi:pyruvate dehydrogenase E1 component beta subunit